MDFFLGKIFERNLREMEADARRAAGVSRPEFLRKYNPSLIKKKSKGPQLAGPSKVGDPDNPDPRFNT